MLKPNVLPDAPRSFGSYNGRRTLWIEGDEESYDVIVYWPMRLNGKIDVVEASLDALETFAEDSNVLECGPQTAEIHVQLGYFGEDVAIVSIENIGEWPNAQSIIEKALYLLELEDEEDENPKNVH